MRRHKAPESPAGSDLAKTDATRRGTSFLRRRHAQPRKHEAGARKRPSTLADWMATGASCILLLLSSSAWAARACVSGHRTCPSHHAGQCSSPPPSWHGAPEEDLSRPAPANQQCLPHPMRYDLTSFDDLTRPSSSAQRRPFLGTGQA